MLYNLVRVLPCDVIPNILVKVTFQGQFLMETFQNKINSFTVNANAIIRAFTVRSELSVTVTLMF